MAADSRKQDKRLAASEKRGGKGAKEVGFAVASRGLERGALVLMLRLGSAKLTYFVIFIIFLHRLSVFHDGVSWQSLALEGLLGLSR